MITIATVCGMGLGTSMMLAMQVRQLMKDEGIDARVNPVDLGSFKAQPADIVVTTTAMGHQVAGTTAKVVLIDNLIDRQHVKARVMEAVDAFRAGE